GIDAEADTRPRLHEELAADRQCRLALGPDRGIVAGPPAAQSGAPRSTGDGPAAGREAARTVSAAMSPEGGARFSGEDFVAHRHAVTADGEVGPHEPAARQHAAAANGRPARIPHE